VNHVRFFLAAASGALTRIAEFQLGRVRGKKNAKLGLGVPGKKNARPG
jgi:hypothetical protein